MISPTNHATKRVRQRKRILPLRSFILMTIFFAWQTSTRKVNRPLREALSDIGFCDGVVGWGEILWLLPLGVAPWGCDVAVPSGCECRDPVDGGLDVRVGGRDALVGGRDKWVGRDDSLTSVGDVECRASSATTAAVARAEVAVAANVAAGTAALVVAVAAGEALL